MAAQWKVPGGPYLQEITANAWKAPGGPYVNETVVTTSVQVPYTPWPQLGPLVAQ